MKRILNALYTGAAVMLILLTFSCKPEKFEEKVLPDVKLAFSNSGRLAVPTNNNFTKDNDFVTIPVTITLSGPAPKILFMGLSANPDTVNTLIANGTLANTAALPLQNYNFPTTAEIRFGVKDFTFDVKVPITAVEANYGKDLVFAINVDNPVSGGSVEAGKRTLLVVVNTAGVLKAEELHFVFFEKGESLLTLPEANYTKDAATFTIPLSILLSGSVGNLLTVNLSANQDTVNKLIAAKVLTNTVALNIPGIDLPATATIGLNQANTIISLKLFSSEIFKNYPQKSAVAVTLSNPSKYKISEAKKTVVIVVDPLKTIDDFTSLLKNTTRPFAFTSRDAAGRWGILANWTSNAAVNSVGGFGSFDNNNSTNIAMESGFGRPNITNGKIFQTISLPAGKYSFDVIARTGTTQEFYVVAAEGATVPDANRVTTTSLGFVRINGTAGATHKAAFTLTKTTQVSLGFSATLTGNQSVNIQDVKLTNVLN